MTAGATITQGTGNVSSAGAYALPANGRAAVALDVRRQMFWTLTAVTLDASGKIAFDPRAQGFDYPLSFVTGWYQAKTNTDHQYIVQSWDPVNLLVNVWDLTDNDNGANDVIVGQFVIMAVSE